MASYSPTAFDQFRTQQVDLDPDQTAAARTSRDFLEKQISALPTKDSAFPKLWSDYEHFGSFARRTKVRPLDDIDLMPLLEGSGVTVLPDGDYTYRMVVQGDSHPLRPYSDSNNVNSTKILNKLKASLINVPNYRNSDVKRNGEAVTLNLTSYAWSFDIVPAIPGSDGRGGVDCYYIPNGSGKWKKSDPRKDQIAISTENQRHNGNLIPLIRLIKYWNENSRAAPRLSSYYFEAMLLAGFRLDAPIVNIRRAVPNAFRHLENRVVGLFPDPNGFGPYLDRGFSLEDQKKVQTAAAERVKYANYALDYEDRSDHKNAIMWWGYVFPNFPAYG